MTHRFCLGLILLLLGLLSACGEYDIKLNERVVYSPEPLFSDFETADPALQECLEQAIADNVVAHASQLTSLNCSHAAISDLQGLEVFTGLAQLKLSSNTIRNLAPVSALTVLEELYLDSNKVIDPVPLYQLPSLRLLDLSDNPGLQCPDSNGFLRIESVTLPSHCR